MVTVLTFLGKDMMTYAVTWVKKKNDGLKSPRNARNFLPNKTSPLLRLCDRLLLPPRLHTSFLPSSPPPPHPRRNPKWTPAPARTTPPAPRRRSSATSAAAARAWSRLSPPVCYPPLAPFCSGFRLPVWPLRRCWRVACFVGLRRCGEVLPALRPRWVCSISSFVGFGATDSLVGARVRASGSCACCSEAKFGEFSGREWEPYTGRRFEVSDFRSMT